METEKNKEYKIIIRDAEESDCQSIVSLLKELGYSEKYEDVLLKIKKLSKRSNDRILVAIREEEVAAVLSLHIIPLLHRKGNLCRITALVVAQKHRHHYIGQRLMEMAEAYALTRDCERIEVTSGDQRTDAHQFYERLGYSEVSRRFIKET
jgi:N-acetylglutamate synthase-like GNAT family acetyltransferase